MKKILLAILLSVSIIVSFSAPARPIFNPLRSSVILGGGGITHEMFDWAKKHSEKGPTLIISAYKLDVDYWGGLVGDFTSIILSEESDTDSPQNIKKALESAIVIWVGGNQWNYVKLAKDSKLVEIISHRFNEEKIVLIGNSAGTAIMGEYFFSARYGGLSTEDVEKSRAEIDIQRRFFNIPQLKNTLVDTHFSERNRWGRLQIFLEFTPRQVRGIGIDEETALAIDEFGNETLIGNGKSHLVSRQLDFQKFSNLANQIVLR